MRTQTRDSSYVAAVRGAKPQQTGRISVVVVAFSALAAGALLEACTVTRLDTDVASGGRSNTGSAGRGGDRAGSTADGDSTSGGPSRQGGMGGVAGLTNGALPTSPWAEVMGSQARLAKPVVLARVRRHRPIFRLARA